MKLNEVVNGTYEQRLDGYIQQAKFRANNSKIPTETIRQVLIDEYGDNVKELTIKDIVMVIQLLQQRK